MCNNLLLTSYSDRVPDAGVLIKKNDFLTNSINARLCLNRSKNFVYAMKNKASLQGSTDNNRWHRKVLEVVAGIECAKNEV